MVKKTVPLNKTNINKLSNDKPATYLIITEQGRVNYAGVAKRNRLQERLIEHLPGATDYVPGTRVQIVQHPTIEIARKHETKLIKKHQPVHNKQGKIKIS